MNSRRMAKPSGSESLRKSTNLEELDEYCGIAHEEVIERKSKMLEQLIEEDSEHKEFKHENVTIEKFYNMKPKKAPSSSIRSSFFEPDNDFFRHFVMNKHQVIKEIEAGTKDSPICVDETDGNLNDAAIFEDCFSGDDDDIDDGNIAIDSKDVCGVCQRKIENQTTLDTCFHNFCFPCIKTWTRKLATCPTCDAAFSSFYYDIKDDQTFETCLVQIGENEIKTEPTPEPECCSICLEDFEDRACLEGCHHNFCFKCISDWSTKKKICPLCNGGILAIYHNIQDDHTYDTFIPDESPPSDQTRPVTPDQSHILQQPSSNPQNSPSPISNAFIQQPVTDQSILDLRTTSPLNSNGALIFNTWNDNATPHGQPVIMSNVDLIRTASGITWYNNHHLQSLNITNSASNDNGSINLIGGINAGTSNNNGSINLIGGINAGTSNDNGSMNLIGGINAVTSNDNGSINLIGGNNADANQSEHVGIPLGWPRLVSNMLPAAPTYNANHSFNQGNDYNQNVITNYIGHHQFPSYSQQSVFCNTSQSGTQTNSTMNFARPDNSQASSNAFSHKVLPVNNFLNNHGLNNPIFDLQNDFWSPERSNNTYQPSYLSHGNNFYQAPVIQPTSVHNSGHLNVISQQGASYVNPLHIPIDKSSAVVHPAHSTTDNSLIPGTFTDDYLQNLPAANNHSWANDQHASTNTATNPVQDQSLNNKRRLIDWDPFLNFKRTRY